uniref:Uncharacterized protein n=1 Tax=Anopheles atroparvus TaxID=41427 RepID=A0A182IT47_ANOAO
LVCSVIMEWTTNDRISQYFNYTCLGKRNIELARLKTSYEKACHSEYFVRVVKDLLDLNETLKRKLTINESNIRNVIQQDSFLQIPTDYMNKILSNLDEVRFAKRKALDLLLLKVNSLRERYSNLLLKTFSCKIHVETHDPRASEENCQMRLVASNLNRCEAAIRNARNVHGYYFRIGLYLLKDNLNNNRSLAAMKQALQEQMLLIRKTTLIGRSVLENVAKLNIDLKKSTRNFNTFREVTTETLQHHKAVLSTERSAIVDATMKDIDAKRWTSRYDSMTQSMEALKIEKENLQSTVLDMKQASFSIWETKILSEMDHKTEQIMQVERDIYEKEVKYKQLDETIENMKYFLHAGSREYFRAESHENGTEHILHAQAWLSVRHRTGADTVHGADSGDRHRLHIRAVDVAAHGRVPDAHAVPGVDVPHEAGGRRHPVAVPATGRTEWSECGRRHERHRWRERVARQSGPAGRVECGLALPHPERDVHGPVGGEPEATDGVSLSAAPAGRLGLAAAELHREPEAPGRLDRARHPDGKARQAVVPGRNDRQSDLEHGRGGAERHDGGSVRRRDGPRLREAGGAPDTHALRELHGQWVPGDHRTRCLVLPEHEQSPADAERFGRAGAVALEAESRLCVPDGVRATEGCLLPAAGGRHPHEEGLRDDNEKLCPGQNGQKGAQQLVRAGLLSTRFHRKNVQIRRSALVNNILPDVL